MIFELRKYSFGETLGKGINLYFNNIIPLVLLSMVCSVASIVVARSGAAIPMLGLVVNLFTTALLSGYMIVLVSNKYLGKRELEGSTLSRVMPFIPNIILASLLAGIIVGLGSILLVIPGLIAFCGLAFVPHAVVLEKKGITDSLKRSWELTNGHKVTIFGLHFVVTLISFLFAFPVSYLSESTGGGLGVLIEPLLNATITPVMAAVLVVQYFNMRVENENFGVEHLADQFTVDEEQRDQAVNE